MTIQILSIDGDSGCFSTLEKYLKCEPWTHICASAAEIGTVQKQLDEECWDILIADPLAFPGLSEQLLSKKKKTLIPELILYSDKDRLDRVLNQFSAHVFACHIKPVEIRTLALSVNQAAAKIRLKKKTENLTGRLENARTKQRMLDQLFDEIPCHISVQDKDFKIRKVNKQFKSQFGRGIGEYCYQVYKNKPDVCEVCPVAQTFNDGKSHATEEVVTTKNGSPYNVLTRTAPIRDENGTVTRVMELSVNITQIRQLNEHLASMGLMLGSMFHAVKGTLTALDGGLYHLETGISRKEPAKVADAYEQIKTMVDKIKKMVAEILDYAKSRELHYERVEISNFVQNIEKTCRPMADRAGVRFNITGQSHPGTIEADAGWLEAALVNMIENSVEACTADQAKKNHEVGFTVSQPSKDQVCFTVSDNGTGMDAEIKDKLFAMFFTSKGGKGTGLGMFIANRVIQYHGGKVRFQSAPGKEAVFNVYLPRKKGSGGLGKTPERTDIYPEMFKGIHGTLL